MTTDQKCECLDDVCVDEWGYCLACGLETADDCEELEPDQELLS